MILIVSLTRSLLSKLITPQPKPVGDKHAHHPLGNVDRETTFSPKVGGGGSGEQSQIISTHVNGLASTGYALAHVRTITGDVPCPSMLGNPGYNYRCVGGDLALNAVLW